MWYESAITFIYLDNIPKIFYEHRDTYVHCIFFPLKHPYWKRTCPFGRLLVLTNVNPWNPNANSESCSSHYVRLSTAVSYVRLSRVISGKFTRRFQYICMQKDRPRLLFSSSFFCFIQIYVIVLKFDFFFINSFVELIEQSKSVDNSR